MKRFIFLFLVFIVDKPVFSITIDDFAVDNILVTDERYFNDDTLLIEGTPFRVAGLKENVTKEFEDVGTVHASSGFPRGSVDMQQVSYTVQLESLPDKHLFEFQCTQDRPASERLRSIGAKTTAMQCPFRFSIYAKGLRVIYQPKTSGAAAARSRQLATYSR
jgi:hypothetical protein